MKKVAVMAIAVLFLSGGLCYASNPKYDSEGTISNITLTITYEDLLPGTSTLQEGVELLTVKSGLNEVSDGKSVYEPEIYFKQDPSTGLIERILISWLGPNVNDITNGYYTSGERILTIACAGGNQLSTQTPSVLPESTDGGIGAKPRVSISTPPAIETRSVEGLAGCSICPSGIATPATPTGLCNDGTSWVNGYITYTGTLTKNTSTGVIISSSIRFTVGASGFTYNGEDWAVDLNSKGISEKDCNNISTTPPYYSLCTAILTGTNTAHLASCDTGSTYLNCIPISP